MRWRVSYYQCGCEGFEPSFHNTKEQAAREASQFVRALMPLAGHHLDGNVRRDGYVRLIDRQGLTEAGANIRQEH